ncbi:MAG: TadE/TadG family type IV pilus assembly protein [Holosporales bacterium]
MMRKVKTLFGRFFKSNQGVTVLEFGLVAPLFLVLLMGIFEISIIITKNIIAENAMRAVGRDAILSAANSSSAAVSARMNELTFDFIDNVEVSYNGSCTDRNKNCLCIAAYADSPGSDASAASRAQSSTADCPASETGVNPTTPNALVVYRLNYFHNFFTPLGAILRLIGSDPESGFAKGRLDFTTTTIVQNEPF